MSAGRGPSLPRLSTQGTDAPQATVNSASTDSSFHSQRRSATNGNLLSPRKRPGSRGHSPITKKRSLRSDNDGASQYGSLANPISPANLLSGRNSVPDAISLFKDSALKKKPRNNVDMYRLSDKNHASTSTKAPNRTSSESNARTREEAQANESALNNMASPVSMQGDSAQTGSGGSTPAPPAPSMTTPVPQTAPDRSGFQESGESVHQIASRFITARVGTHQRDLEKPGAITVPTNLTSLRRLREQKKLVAEAEYEGSKRYISGTLAMEKTDTSASTTKGQAQPIDNAQIKALRIELDLLKRDNKSTNDALRKLQNTQQDLKHEAASAQEQIDKAVQEQLTKILRDMPKQLLDQVQAQFEKNAKYLTGTLSAREQLITTKTAAMETDLRDLRDTFKAATNNCAEKERATTSTIDLVTRILPTMKETCANIRQDLNSLESKEVFGLKERLKVLEDNFERLQMPSSLLQTFNSEGGLLQRISAVETAVGGLEQSAEKATGLSNQLIAQQSAYQVQCKETESLRCSIADLEEKIRGGSAAQNLRYDILAEVAKEFEPLSRLKQDFAAKVDQFRTEIFAQVHTKSKEFARETETTLLASIRASNEVRSSQMKDEILLTLQRELLRIGDGMKAEKYNEIVTHMDTGLGFLEGEIKRLDDMVMAMDATHRKATAEPIRELDARVRALGGQFSQLDHRLSHLKAQPTAAHTEISELRAEIGSTQETFRTFEGRLERLHDSNNDLQRKLASSDAFNRLSGEVTGLQNWAKASIVQQQQQINSLHGSVEMTNEHINHTATEARQDVHKALKDVQGYKDKTAMAIGSLEYRYDQITSEELYKRMVHELQRTYPDAPAFLHSLKRLQATLGGLQQRFANSEGTIQSELRSVQGTLATVKQTLQVVQNVSEKHEQNWDKIVSAVAQASRAEELAVDASGSCAELNECFSELRHTCALLSSGKKTHELVTNMQEQIDCERSDRVASDNAIKEKADKQFETIVSTLKEVEEAAKAAEIEANVVPVLQNALAKVMSEIQDAFEDLAGFIPTFTPPRLAGGDTASHARRNPSQPQTHTPSQPPQAPSGLLSNRRGRKPG